LKISNSTKTLLLTALVLVPGYGYSQVTSGQSYRIFSACDLTKVMGVLDASLSDKAAVVLQTNSSTKSSQVFKFETYSSGYKITAQNSGKTLNIIDASSANNAILEQYKFTGVPSEVFKLSTTTDGYVRLQNVNSLLFVNLRKALTADGTPFEQYASTTACAEKFKLIAVTATSPTPTPSPTPISDPPPPTPTPTPAPSPTPTGLTRDPLKQPFASNSIWNMPIGSGAQFVPANLGTTSHGAPGIDDERIILKPTAPMTTVNYSSAAWSGANRCSATGGQYASVPMPSSYIVPNGGGNSGATALMPDKRTIVQFQPLARCNVGGYATTFTRPVSTDLYGAGIGGAHGGSGLSAFGGSIRLGELRPGQQGPRHVLKLNVYAAAHLYKCTTRSACFRWPATTADSYAVGHYGTVNNNQNLAMKMGALLAIPGSINISSLGLETEPGRQMAWTLQNYGTYIVDDAWGSGYGLSAENGPDGSLRSQFQSDYGTPFEIASPGSTAWSRDFFRLMKALSVVNNNSATSIGGGGTPRQPLAPPIAP
jgi:hypothetical protein